MRFVELIAGVRSSVLGFGCAPILGSVDAGTAARAIDAAISVGVNHFDIARSYGYGSAEAFLGQTLAGKRDQVVIATKFGIVASRWAALAAPAKPILRRIMSASKRAADVQRPTQSEFTKQLSGWLHREVPFTPANMRKSL